MILKFTRHALLAALATIAVVGCSSTKEQPTSLDVPTADTSHINIDSIALLNTNEMFDTIRSLYLQESKPEPADLVSIKSILEGVNTSFLTQQQKHVHSYLIASTAFHLGQNSVAEPIYRELVDSNDLKRFNKAEQKLILQRLVAAEGFLSKHSSAAYYQFLVCKEFASQDCNSLIVSHLMRAHIKSLDQFSDRDPRWQSWTELAKLLMDNSSDVDGQVSQLKQWRSQFLMQHPNDQVPIQVDTLIAALENSPKKIVAVLPLTGTYKVLGQAVKEGLLISYFNNPRISRADNQTELTFIDSNTPDYLAKLQSADLNSDLIIGPLLKDKVTEVANAATITTPTIALNLPSESYDGNHAQLFFFPLKFDDEAREGARHIWQTGYRQPLLLIAGKTHTKEISDTFTASWTEVAIEGNNQVNSERLTVPSNYSNEIAKALHINASNKRARNIRLALNETIEHTPRRRKDVDSIFIHATPSHARQIKPLIAFHYGNDLPIFATSAAFNGKFDHKLDQDLNDVTVQLQPWVINQDQADAQAILEYSIGNPNLQSLTALGSDALLVGLRIKYISVVPHSEFSAHTGRLQIVDNNRIRRILSWGTYKNGLLSTDQHH